MKPPLMFDIRELEYELPEDRIAQAPLPERDGARLLCLPVTGEQLRHGRIRDLAELLSPSLIVLNDTRVLPARLLGHKSSGGKVELLLVERISEQGTSERWHALGRASKGLRIGERIRLAAETGGEQAETGVSEQVDAVGHALQAEIIALRDGTLEIELTAPGSVSQALARVGRMPLPPYIRRSPTAADGERYQTVFATQEGAVAAPTAGLHLSQRVLTELRALGHEIACVTLHVGPGTFAPLRSSDLASHRMHAERYVIPETTAQAIAEARRQGRQVLAVGTTVVRALEAATDSEGVVRAGPGKTALFIHPPYVFRSVDALLTNFHLPRSTLLALVMAFGGIAPIRRAYQEAIAQGYRFYSYGDAMLIGGMR
jgi:S-adenosylmethionine:tRNA ribosyltransferase-isomerase